MQAIDHVVGFVHANFRRQSEPTTLAKAKSGTMSANRQKGRSAQTPRAGIARQKS